MGKAGVLASRRRTDGWTVAITAAYLVVLVLEFDTAVVHDVENESHGLDDVVEYYGLPFELLAFGEALRIDQPHLLEDRRLARFSGTCASATMISSHHNTIVVGRLGLGLLVEIVSSITRSGGTGTTTTATTKQQEQRHARGLRKFDGDHYREKKSSTYPAEEASPHATCASHLGE